MEREQIRRGGEHIAEVERQRRQQEELERIVKAELSPEHKAIQQRIQEQAEHLLRNRAGKAEGEMSSGGEAAHAVASPEAEALGYGVRKGAHLDAQQLTETLIKWRQEFLHLTGTVCRDAQGELDVEKLKAWQQAHGLAVTGFVDQRTLEVARRRGAAHGHDSRADEQNTEARSTGYGGEAQTHKAEASHVHVFDKDAAQLAEQFPVKKVPPFPEGLLRHGENLPISAEEWLRLILLVASLPDGPHIVGPYPIRVGDVVAGEARYLVWVEGGQIMAWMPVMALPRGGMRRGEWLLFSDGEELQTLRDRTHDIEVIRRRRPDLDEKWLRHHKEAAEMHNRDVESFVAEGMPISEALRQNEKVQKDVFGIFVRGAFQALSLTVGVLGAAGAVEDFGQAAGRWLGGKTGAAPKAEPRQHEFARLVADIPALERIPPTKDNFDGMRRLQDVIYDEHLPAEVRGEFLGELRARLGEGEVSTERLFRAMQEIAQKRPERYLRQGMKVPDAAYVRREFGGLKRVISLRGCYKMFTEEFYRRAWELDRSLPKDFADFKWEDAPKVVKLIKSGQVPFDPKAHLRPDALIEGKEPGSSGWFFASNDASTASPKELQTQLAVGHDYADGYIVVELPAHLAQPAPDAQGGASRPTALDLTVAPEGKLNSNSFEPFGRTDPQAPGQRPVREVVLSPLQLKDMSNVIYVKGN